MTPARLTKLMVFMGKGAITKERCFPIFSIVVCAIVRSKDLTHDWIGWLYTTLRYARAKVKQFLRMHLELTNIYKNYHVV